MSATNLPGSHLPSSVPSPPGQITAPCLHVTCGSILRQKHGLCMEPAPHSILGLEPPSPQGGLLLGLGAASWPRTQLSAVKLTLKHLSLSSRSLPCPLAASFQVAPGYERPGLNRPSTCLSHQIPSTKPGASHSRQKRPQLPFVPPTPCTSCNSKESGPWLLFNKPLLRDFPDGPVVMNPPASAGNGF